MIKKKTYKQISLLGIGILLGFYINEQFKLIPKIGIPIIDAWLPNILWVIVIVIMIGWLPKIHPQGKLKYCSVFYIGAFNISVAYIVISLGLGVLQGFGKSPYDHSIAGMFTNVILVSCPLIGREYIRHYIVNTGVSHRYKGVIPLVVCMMSFLSIRIYQWTDIQSLEQLTVFAANTLLPTISEQALATYLVLYGGPIASIIYLGLIEGFEWLSPILPDLSWLLKGVIGMMVPTVGIIILNHQYDSLMGFTKLREEKSINIYEYLGAALVSVLIIWFVVGVFPVYPSAIATGSMEPMIWPGDVVLVRKVQDQTDIDSLQVGDVIQFQREDVLINHRIIEIDKDKDGTQYQTKGDNNSAPDSDWVQPEDIKGTIVKVIPKIGWPTLMLKNSQKAPPIAVEF